VRLDDLIERDGGKCVWCGRQPWRSDLTAEHLLPIRRGGRTLPENLAPACRVCNRRRGTQPVVAVVRARQRAAEPVAIDRLQLALRRLAASNSAVHAGYARRQLELLERLAGQLR
jgi:hypothetical protein